MGNKPSPSRGEQRERFWRKIVSGLPGSGLSVVAWCSEHGVSAPSFYVWRRRLMQRDAERKSRQPQLLPVEIVRSATDEGVAALEIELPSRVRVRVRPGCELELLRRVLTLLQQDDQEGEGC